MGHYQHHSLKDYWPREEQYCTSFYPYIMAHDHFFHILRFLHFENNDNPNYNRLWKIRKIFDTLNNKFCELYNPTEHLAVDEVIVLYKGRVVFRQYIPKKHKRFGIRIYKLCDTLGYTYDMSIYLGKQRQHATAQVTATHGAVLQVIRRVEGLGHKIFMDSYFTSPALFDDLLITSIHIESCYEFIYNQASQIWGNIMPLSGQHFYTNPFIVSPVSVAVIFVPPSMEPNHR